MENKLQENARWNVKKTIRCLVRNKIKHRKKYKIGKSPTPEISLSCTLPGVRLYMSQPEGEIRISRYFSRKNVTFRKIALHHGSVFILINKTTILPHKYFFY